jgi:hypothetical protein
MPKSAETTAENAAIINCLLGIWAHGGKTAILILDLISFSAPPVPVQLAFTIRV